MWPSLGSSPGGHWRTGGHSRALEAVLLDLMSALHVSPSPTQAGPGLAAFRSADMSDMLANGSASVGKGASKTKWDGMRSGRNPFKHCSALQLGDHHASFESPLSFTALLPRAVLFMGGYGPRVSSPRENKSSYGDHCVLFFISLQSRIT